MHEDPRREAGRRIRHAIADGLGARAAHPNLSQMPIRKPDESDARSGATSVPRRQVVPQPPSTIKDRGSRPTR